MFTLRRSYMRGILCYFSVYCETITLNSCSTMHGTTNIKFANAQQIEHIIPPATLLT
jgi:hypothetical protein